eukprot:SAG11_NODE_1660_length_4498_cov_5.293021_8_plen_73_part_01
MFESTSKPVVVIGVYVPHHGRVSSDVVSSMDDVLEELRKLVWSFGDSVITIVMGDFNARMERNIKGICGKWTV